MVAIVAPEGASALMRACEGSGVAAWGLGEVVNDDGRAVSEDVLRGAKGVDGGAVYLSGSYRTA
jgi:phosphoribosylformylglycinamidine cyclo-ligase